MKVVKKSFALLLALVLCIGSIGIIPVSAKGPAASEESFESALSELLLLKEGDVITVNLKIPSRNNLVGVRYYTTDSSVAKVTKKGKITAVGKGACIIEVVYYRGAKKKAIPYHFYIGVTVGEDRLNTEGIADLDDILYELISENEADETP